MRRHPTAVSVARVTAALTNVRSWVKSRYCSWRELSADDPVPGQRTSLRDNPAEDHEFLRATKKGSSRLGRIPFGRPRPSWRPCHFPCAFSPSAIVSA
jgi:hypothetical protein